jgi:hypothetical protein
VDVYGLSNPLQEASYCNAVAQSSFDGFGALTNFNHSTTNSDGVADDAALQVILDIWTLVTSFSFTVSFDI